MNNSIGDSGASFLSEALEVNSTLTSLNLKDNLIHCMIFHGFHHINKEQNWKKETKRNKTIST